MRWLAVVAASVGIAFAWVTPAIAANTELVKLIDRAAKSRFAENVVADARRVDFRFTTPQGQTYQFTLDRDRKGNPTELTVLVNDVNESLTSMYLYYDYEVNGFLDCVQENGAMVYSVWHGEYVDHQNLPAWQGRYEKIREALKLLTDRYAPREVTARPQQVKTAIGTSLSPPLPKKKPAKPRERELGRLFFLPAH